MRSRATVGLRGREVARVRRRGHHPDGDLQVARWSNGSFTIDCYEPMGPPLTLAQARRLGVALVAATWRHGRDQSAGVAAEIRDEVERQRRAARKQVTP